MNLLWMDNKKFMDAIVFMQMKKRCSWMNFIQEQRAKVNE